MSLKSMRKDRGLTQREAAALFGIKYRTYQNYENGATFPDMDTAARFARYFSCTIGDLFDLQEGHEAPLTDVEKELLGAYQSMTDEGQKTLIAIASTLVTVFPKM